MSLQQVQCLDEAVSLSRQMVERGEAGEWGEVIELESRRSHLLARAFEKPSHPDDQTARLIHVILDSDKRLMNLSVVARDEAAAELTQMQRGRKVQQAYRDAGA